MSLICSYQKTQKKPQNKQTKPKLSERTKEKKKHTQILVYRHPILGSSICRQVVPYWKRSFQRSSCSLSCYDNYWYLPIWIKKNLLQMMLRHVEIQQAKDSKPVTEFHVISYSHAKHCTFEVTYSIAKNNVSSILASNCYKWSHSAKTRETTGYLEKRTLVFDLWCQNYYCFQLGLIFITKCMARKIPQCMELEIGQRR